ncbi:MAG: TolC family protein [Chthoniobacterales bacterium]|nr:TolC family protein [Chthoniobacterales bacterium]
MHIFSVPLIRRHSLTALGLLALCSFALAGSETTSKTSSSASSARRFTLHEAIETALQRNPDILRARQEIRRTKGVQIEVLSQALPHLDATAALNYTDPSLQNGSGGSSIITTPGGGPTPIPVPSATPLPTASPGTTTTTTFTSSGLSDYSYNVRLTVSQLLYNGSIIPAIRGAGAAADASLFGLRDTIDRVIAAVRQQFYLVILNRALIGVQEESVQLLESQLKDQQNRFEAGTVPRFNVLQAEVALVNQQPALITARNNYRIAQIELARTIGLDFDPRRGNQPPLECVGELSFQPRSVPLPAAIALGKERRPFLKQQRANILVQVQNLSGSYAGIQPELRLAGGHAIESSPFSSNTEDAFNGWFFGVTGSWAIFDGLETAGRVKQARATLSQAKITYDDAVRQVELEVQQAYSNLQQDRELYESQSKNVDQAHEALRLASARLGVGAGVQLDVLNAQVALTQAQSTRLSALYSYNADLAEFDRVTATDTIYHDDFSDPMTGKRRETRMIKTKTTESSRVEASGK